MPAPIPTAVSSILPYTFHQVAMFCPLGEDQALRAVDFWRDQGFGRWITDTSLLVGRYDDSYEGYDHGGLQVQTKATMFFNYDIMAGMELEFLAYENVRGKHRWSGTIMHPSDPFITHMSTYVDDVKLEARKMTRFFGFPPYHRFITTNNTNPAVHGKKRFIECIFATRDLIGYDVKLIEKVCWDYQDSDWLNFEI
jgi:hypothetical protein